MDNCETIFLCAAKELNFSKTAKQFFMTPQSVSEYIRRLENRYNATLFIRRPHLQLTAEGSALYRHLLRVKDMEYKLTNELADLHAGLRGTIRFGIALTRGRILVPHVLPSFQEKFPNVDVQIFLGDVPLLEERLLSGKLDLFLGLGTSNNPLFKRYFLNKEELYLAIPKFIVNANIKVSHLGLKRS